MSQQPKSSAEAQPGGGSALVSDQGRTSIADSVVLKIAGVAAREVAGVHAMGSGGARAFGALKDKLPGSSGPSPTQGVTVEVGERQAAIDIDLVVEYGVSIPDVSQAVRRNVIQRVERMTGLEVTEVNLSVDDVYLGGDDEEQEPEPSRVQ
jgi:uncharacterized alkaline shock family protein YloU